MYLRIAFRRLRTDKLYSIISITGLAISIAVSVVVFRYAHYELNYDSFFTDANRIFRVTSESLENGRVVYRSALCPQPVGDALKNDFAEVEAVTQLHSTANWFTCTMRYDHGTDAKFFNESGVFFGDGSFFDVFDWHLTEGDGSSALQAPHRAVVTQSTARRYFGNESALGKILHLQGSIEDDDYTVTGVIPDIPDDSHLAINVILSASSLANTRYSKDVDCYTYFRAQRHTNPGQFSGKLSRLMAARPEGANTSLHVEPITAIHFNGGRQDEMKASGDSKTVYFLLVVAGLVLLIALINYVNLATARAIQRAREVGVRKVSGARRGQLIAQLLVESGIVYTLSFAAAWGLVSIGVHSLESLSGWQGIFVSSTKTLTVVALVAIAALMVLLFVAAWYPAKMISSFDARLVLKGKFTSSPKGLVLRRTLVVFQFICTIGLMTTVFVMHDQYDFMQQQDTGFRKSGMLIVRAPSTVIDERAYDRVPEFKKLLERLSVVQSVSTSSNIPGQRINWTGNLKKSKDRPVAGRNFSVQLIDPDYLENFGLHLVAGRNLSESDFPKSRRFGSQLENILLNETAISQLGYHSPDEVVGKIIYFDDNACLVRGVVADYHQESLQNPIAPTVFSANIGASMSIRLNPAVNTADAVALVTATWVSFFPDCPFDYFFLDDFFSSQYAADLQLVRIFDAFCGLAVMISCLGLFALSLFATRQRTKELGIRKVLGATFQHLTGLLLRDFLWPVALACVVAMPFLVVMLQQWLSRFAFRTQLSVGAFIIPVLLVISIAVMTVAFQTVRTALANPADALRHE